MSTPVVSRPPILRGACLYLGVLSAIIAIRAVTVVSSWNSESREDDFAGALDALRDAGLSASGAVTTYKTMIVVVAVLAACGAVFAVYTAQGHRSSRVGMTVAIGVAGVLAFVGALGGGFLFAMVGALAVVFTIRMWTGEIRTYFRTLAGHEPPAPKITKVDPFAPTPSGVAPLDPAPHGPSGAVAPSPPPQGQAPPGYYRPPAPAALPRPVSIAVWTTLVGSAIVAFGSGIGLLGLGLIGDDYEQMVRDSPFSERMMNQSSLDYDQLYRLSLTFLGICLPLALGGLAAAILVLVKKRTGDVFLFVMAALTVVMSVLLFPVGLPWTAAAIVCLVQLRRRESRAWFAKT